MEPCNQEPFVSLIQLSVPAYSWDPPQTLWLFWTQSKKPAESRSLPTVYPSFSLVEFPGFLTNHVLVFSSPATATHKSGKLIRKREKKKKKKKKKKTAGRGALV
jgi:hypothetical protein